MNESLLLIFHPGYFLSGKGSRAQQP